MFAAAALATRLTKVVLQLAADVVHMHSPTTLAAVASLVVLVFHWGSRVVSIDNVTGCDNGATPSGWPHGRRSTGVGPGSAWRQPGSDRVALSWRRYRGGLHYIGRATRRTPQPRKPQCEE